MRKEIIDERSTANSFRRRLSVTLPALLTVLFMWPFVAFPSEGPTSDEDFYRRLLESDVAALKERGMELVVSRPDSAISYFSVVAARYDSDMSAEERRICAASMNNLGYLHFFHNNDPILAYSYLVKGMSVAEGLGLQDIIANLSLNTANVYCVLDDYDSAMHYYKKAVAAAAVSHEYETLLTAMSNMMTLLYTAHPDRIGDTGPERALFRRTSIPDSIPMYGYTNALLRGVEASSRRDYAVAEREFTACLRCIDTRYTPERFRLQVYSLLAGMEYMRGDYGKAVAYLRQSLAESEAPDIRASMYYRLRKCYEKLGMTDSAAHFGSRYIALSDTLLRSGQAKILRDIETQVASSELNDKIAKASADRRNMAAVMIVSLVALVVMTLLGVWLWVSRGRLRKANEELYRRTKQKSIWAATGTEEGVEVADLTDSPGHTDSEDDFLADALRRIMDNSDEVYLPDFSLNALARLAGVSARKVSQVINTRFGTNFSTFLQEYRVREACRRFDDRGRFGSMTIEAISESLGFRSRSNFVAVFKKFTGLTPSAYQKISRRH